MLAPSSEGERKLDMMDAAALQPQVKIVLEAQTLLQKEVTAKVQCNRERQREEAP